jgi:hypothetical protein
MAYVSLGLNLSADNEPDAVAIGTDDGGAGNNVTVCVNLAVALNNSDIVRILQVIETFLLDGRLDQLTISGHV